MVEAQGADAVADLVQAFDSQGGDELGIAEGVDGRLVGGSWGEVFGIEGVEAVVEIYLFDGLFDD